MSTVITSIDHRSPAERAGVRTGERLVSIGGHAVEDVLDYRFFGYDRDPALVLESPEGSRRTVRVKKPEAAELGLNFETYLMDEPRPCSNHCLFCFVDQMAPGCRDTLYFKDDDARLSFLMGNYITLTNLSPREVQRIIDLRISPINVSVHATDPRLRSILLGNKAGGESLEAMRRFGQAGIVMNGQIVLCPGYNDGDQLQRTMEDMAAWGFSSCSIVPVGLTKFREGLSRLRAVDRETAGQVIDQVDAFGARCLERYGSRMFFCSDELYIRAGRALPEEDYYEDYVQIENGVGMLRSLITEFEAGLRLEDGTAEASPYTIDRRQRQALFAGAGGQGQGADRRVRTGRCHCKRLFRPYHRRGWADYRRGPDRTAEGEGPGGAAAHPGQYAPAWGGCLSGRSPCVRCGAGAGGAGDGGGAGWVRPAGRYS